MEFEFLSQYIQISDTPFGDLQIRYYGIIIVSAMLLATVIAARLASKSGKDPEHVYGALTWAIIPGIILARLWFVLFPPQDVVDAGRDAAWFLENFFNTTDGAIAIWSGGLSIFGALLGGLLGSYIYLRRNKLSIPQWLDIAAVVIPLGQAIGRWANYVNQELYGTPTGVDWWGLTIEIESRPEIYRAIEYYNSKFHPLFLYESVWSAVAFYVLFRLYNNRRNAMRIGDFILIFVAQYSFIRFFLEFIRIQVTNLPGTDINLSQIVTFVAFVGAMGILFLRNNSGSAMTYSEVADYEREQAKQAKAKNEDAVADTNGSEPTPATES